jgi:hypothetical protein
LKRSRNFFSTLFRGSLSVPIKAIMNDNNVIAYDSAQKSLVCSCYIDQLLSQTCQICNNQRANFDDEYHHLHRTPVFCKIDIPFPDLSGRKLRQ